MNVATVHTYLRILSKVPDTFIARKVGLRAGIREVGEAVRKGMEVAMEVSRRAEEALDKGGLLSEEGRKLVEELDRDLRRNKLNPGTTADLTASSIFLSILSGFRP